MKLAERLLPQKPFSYWLSTNRKMFHWLHFHTEPPTSGKRQNTAQDKQTETHYLGHSHTLFSRVRWSLETCWNSELHNSCVRQKNKLLPANTLKLFTEREDECDLGGQRNMKQHCARASMKSSGTVRKKIWNWQKPAIKVEQINNMCKKNVFFFFQDIQMKVNENELFCCV